ncbi:preprotein translocase subunit YajC [Piscirickettsia salmonis]|uniref:Sec translocon accessory complex subunit YajC n=1 Tax=Piscirickettsia salmonis TaxID=1238 RepID=A0A9Q5V9B1_PISSA|nr:preprotein translocase subunit YajC [Piscirickettsia salmonis]RNC78679.1 preprotein translocase subunit YajC [Piscirickettsiaceae bacterium NZ-RLO2]ALA25359.1 preprotein translocase, YajC subunit [Piscirickettsia salmonis]APS45591.1 preprotein translocase subunit YajC [Piscirickettsia salmonis]APS46246.1 preprotein translocase subunit YajC [Piscirickettsia salmonis]APS50180.1 preprotein translocase subunit YajC [Piscirickettsia salmonis]
MKKLFAILGLLAVSSASFAADAPAAGATSSLMSFLPLVVIVIIFYFLLIRPQSKRAKEHRKLLSELAKGDEVSTSGGVLGKVIKVDESVVTIEIANDVEIQVQKSAVSAVLPKGTIK